MSEEEPLQGLELPLGALHAGYLAQAATVSTAHATISGMLTELSLVFDMAQPQMTRGAVVVGGYPIDVTNEMKIRFPDLTEALPLPTDVDAQ